MPQNNTNKRRDKAALQNITKEMAQPRMAESARIVELNRDVRRVHQEPTTTVRGTVKKIVPSTGSSQPEKVQIDLEGRDNRGYRDIRIENSLTDEHGDDLKLKKGEGVDVTVTKHRKSGR